MVDYEHSLPSMVCWGNVGTERVGGNNRTRAAAWPRQALARTAYSVCSMCSQELVVIQL